LKLKLSARGKRMIGRYSKRRRRKRKLSRKLIGSKWSQRMKIRCKARAQRFKIGCKSQRREARIGLPSLLNRALQTGKNFLSKTTQPMSSQPKMMTPSRRRRRLLKRRRFSSQPTLTLTNFLLENLERKL